MRFAFSERVVGCGKPHALRGAGMNLAVGQTERYFQNVEMQCVEIGLWPKGRDVPRAARWGVLNLAVGQREGCGQSGEMGCVEFGRWPRGGMWPERRDERY